MTRKALIAAIQQFISNSVCILKCLRRLFDHSTFSKSFETRFESNCFMQQLQVRKNVVGFEKAFGAVQVIKDQIQYRSQSLLDLALGYFSYRPISLLSAIMKLFERVIGKRLRKHLEDNGFFGRYKSGFRKSKSTNDHLFVSLRPSWKALIGANM